MSLPLIFNAVEKKIRDAKISKLLSEHDLTNTADKYPRYLTPEESGRASSLRREIGTAYPDLERFLKALDEDREARSCLPLIQHELFTSASNNLKFAAKAVRATDFDRAAYLLEDAIDRLVLRTALAPFYEVPSARVLEVALLVVRNYRDLLKYRTKMNEAILKEAEKKITPHLNAIAESFSEIGKSR